MYKVHCMHETTPIVFLKIARDTLAISLLIYGTWYMVYGVVCHSQPFTIPYGKGSAMPVINNNGRVH